jgi:hypothetical protein
MSSKESKHKKKQEATPEKEEKDTKQSGGPKISLAKLEKSITKATGDKLADL